MTASYQTIEVLNSGGMAEVLVAVARQDSGFVKPCIVKRVLPALHYNPTFAALLRVEAQIGSALSHANIVQVQGFARVEGHEAIIMEFIEGVDLEHVLRTCARGALKLSPPMAILITTEVARALAYVHSRGDLVSGKKLHLVHADVTPGNILVSFEGEVKLADFGIASSRLEGGAADLLAYRGKKSYVPPEQAEGRDLDASADIFALGCVLFEMITGARLLTGGDGRYAAIAERLGQGLADQHEDLRAILAKMVALDPAQRYQSAALLERELLQHLEERHGGLARNRLGVFVQTTHSKEQRRCYKLLKDAINAGPPAVRTTPVVPMEAPASSVFALMPGAGVLRRGKDLSLALPKEDLDRVREQLIRNAENAVLSSPASAGLSAEGSAAARAAPATPGVLPPSGRIAAPLPPLLPARISTPAALPTPPASPPERGVSPAPPPPRSSAATPLSPPPARSPAGASLSPTPRRAAAAPFPPPPRSAVAAPLSSMPRDLTGAARPLNRQRDPALPPRSRGGFVAAVVIAIAALGAAVFFSVRNAKSQQAARPAPPAKEATHDSP